MKVLLAVDGSECSLNASRKLVSDIHRFKEPPGVEVLAVHLPVPQVPHLGLVIDREMLERYYREDCEQMLAPARRILDDAGIRYDVRSLVGPIGETIAAEADRLECDYVVMGTHGRTALGNMVIGSVASRVLHLTKVPVLLVH